MENIIELADASRKAEDAAASADQAAKDAAAWLQKVNDTQKLIGDAQAKLASDSPEVKVASDLLDQLEHRTAEELAAAKENIGNGQDAADKQYAVYQQKLADISAQIGNVDTAKASVDLASAQANLAKAEDSLTAALAAPQALLDDINKSAAAAVDPNDSAEDRYLKAKRANEAVTAQVAKLTNSDALTADIEKAWAAYSTAHDAVVTAAATSQQAQADSARLKNLLASYSDFDQALAVIPTLPPPAAPGGNKPPEPGNPDPNQKKP